MYVSRNVNHCRANELSGVLGIALTSNLMKYLGMPLLHSRVKEETYKGIIEKIKNRLSMWQANSLSMVGRITLV